MRLLAVLLLSHNTLAALEWVKDDAAFHQNQGVIRILGAAGLGARSVDEYEDLRLSFDYRLDQWAEAAFVLRSPRHGRPMRAGVAITLAHDFHRQTTHYVTGALTGRRPSLKAMPVSYEAWHHVDATLRGSHLRVEIDGTLVQDCQVESLTRGNILFPNLGHRYSVRGIQVEDLGRPTPLIDLFAGKGVLRGGGKFRFENGTILGENGHGVFYDGPLVSDFEVTLYVRPHQRVNAGVFLRGAPDEKKSRGFEVQVYSPPDAVYPTGSIYGLARSAITQDYEERWFHMRIRVVGRTCQVWIDGDPVAGTDGLPADGPAKGQVGLQIHSDAAWVEFAHVQLLVLPVPRTL